jgi:hypothetical protein
MSDSKSSGAGIGFSGLLAIVFITLKLLEKIDWSWWWVLAPLWLPLVIVLAVIVVFVATRP